LCLHAKKDQKKTLLPLFLRFVHVLWEDNRACVFFFVELERRREKKRRIPKTTQQLSTVVFVIVLVSNKKQREREAKLVSRKQQLSVTVD
jgi:hypothetical protein